MRIADNHDNLHVEGVEWDEMIDEHSETWGQGAREFKWTNENLDELANEVSMIIINLINHFRCALQGSAPRAVRLPNCLTDCIDVLSLNDLMGHAERGILHIWIQRQH